MAGSRKSSKKCSRGSSGVKAHKRSSGKKVMSHCRKVSRKSSRKTSHKSSHKKTSCPDGRKRQRIGSYMRNGKKVKGHFRCIERAM
jgi:hypothetical protein